MNRISRKSLLTARERVLLHLLPLQRYSMDADAPRTVTQDGISSAINVGRNNVAKIMAELETEMTVEVSTRHVKGLATVRRTYFLSQRGFEEAKALKEDIEGVHIDVIDLKGEKHEDDLGRLPKYLPGNYGLLELAMAVERGSFDCQSFHESRVRQEKRFVDFTDKKPAVRTFFGREGELKVLHDLTAPDGPMAVVVYGIPGIGKTTLLAKFAQDVRERTNVFWLKVHEWIDARTLFRPIAEFLSQEGKKRLEWLFGQSDVLRTGEVLQILVSDLSETPVLIIFDDMQKSEKGVLELISALINILDEIPGMRIICATRDQPTFYSRSLVVKNLVKEMQLDGLDDVSSVRMLRARSINEDQLQAMVQIAKGHPLFLELIEDSNAAMGKNIRMFIEQEVVSKLDQAERRVMNVAAVFRYPVIIDAFFITEEEIQKEILGQKAELEDIDYTISYETVDSLLAKSILHESMGRLIGMHDMLREFTYGRLTPRQRMVYHQAASHFYLQDSSVSAQVEALYHSIMAKDEVKAVEIAAGRGEEIIGKGYQNSFSPLLEKLLVNKDLRERTELLCLHGQILDLRGDLEKAMNEYEQALACIDQPHNPRLTAETYRRMAAIEIKRSNLQRSMDNLNEALRLARMADDDSTKADIYYDMGGVEERWGHYQEAEGHFRSAAYHANKVGDRIAIGKAIYGQGRVRASQRKYEEAVHLKREALTILERTGDLNIIAKVSIALGTDLREIHQWEEGLRLQRKAVELATNCGDVSTLGYAFSNLTASYLEMGSVELAEEHLLQATRIFQKLNDPLMTATMHMYRGFLFHLRGDWEWAKEEFQRSIEMLRPLRVSSVFVPYVLEMAVTYSNRGDIDEAAKLLEEISPMAGEIKNEKMMKRVEEELKKINYPLDKKG